MSAERPYIITQFYVEEDVIAEINKFILGARKLRSEIESFVNEQYEDIISPLDSLRIPSNLLVARAVNLDPNVIKKLENIASEAGENVSTNMVFRDMLRQLLKHLKQKTIEQLRREIQEREQKLKKIEKQNEV